MAKKSILREFITYVIIVALAISLSLTIRILIFEPFIVPTPSMEPTLMVRDKVLVNKLSYKFGPINRGDLVAFHSSYENKDLVKRVIALGGEEITLTTEGEIYINGQPYEENYLPDGYNISYQNQTIILNENEIFVMGDNRKNSLDSRYFGTITEEDVFGELVFIYWPPKRFGKI
ncbi:MAG: signal peptidase I [Actinomycetota bacterium]